MENTELSKTVENLKELVIEMRTYNQYSREQNNKQDAILQELVKSNNDNVRRMDKQDQVIGNQNEIIRSHTDDIKILKDERNVNVVKLATTKWVPVIIGSGITAFIVTTFITYITFMGKK